MLITYDYSSYSYSLSWTKKCAITKSVQLCDNCTLIYRSKCIVTNIVYDDSKNLEMELIDKKTNVDSEGSTVTTWSWLYT